MDAALLPYLKRIAESIRNIAKTGIGGSTSVSDSISGSIDIGNAGMRQIAEKLASALIATIQDDQGNIQVSVIDVIRDAVNEALHDANFITVEEEQGGQTVEVEKSIFELIKDDLAAL